MEDSSLHDFRRELDALITLRDELKLKAHLLRADVASELHALNKKVDLAQEQLQRARAHVERDASVVKGELKSLLLDLQQGFRQIKSVFDEH